MSFFPPLSFYTFVNLQSLFPFIYLKLQLKLFLFSMETTSMLMNIQDYALVSASCKGGVKKWMEMMYLF